MNMKFWQRSWWQPPQNNGFKVLAVILALLLWGYVTVTQNPLTEATFSVPVEIRNLASDLAQPDTNYQVQVRVQGTAGVIEDLSSYDIAAYVDLTDMQAGEATPVVNIELPPNVSLVSRSPESLELTLYPKVSQTFSVEVQVRGTPAEGCSLLDPVVTPDIVSLSGSDLSISSVDKVFVAVDVTGLAENYSKNLAVEVLNSAGENITDHFTCYPSTVAVLVPVVQEQPEASLPVRCSVTGEPAAGYKVSRVVVEPSTVLAFGPQEALDEIMYLEADSISVSGLSATTSFTQSVRAPEGISLSRDNVTVVVQIEAVNGTDFTCPLTDFRGLADGLEYSCETKSCTVSLSGTATYLQSLTEDSIHLYVDLSGISEAGTYELEVQAELPGGVALSELSPAAVTVTVTEAAKAEEDQ
ncbi:MAG: hypothetical protein IKD93_06255 [Firmicutes bacterium]|nr:hypothetical protein [Bacillota bacterium]